ncbi:enoyl-CoA hydratase mitochondrial precursor [Conidiobolus coronatus NRRL 28638]|uniref:Probable enoyl-CoA hydratase, mitochondrial n=1 Tax=Conidiobolus coronatus (strain ATCC 28846 / CBS 209.66 / NRRL 28638) TaxID=796925 RepID=A0A137P4D6_CONC2|nr:enoyl-CoA hydratase mitochondrial precursor [Conidiobolus coronatus NRRL 28638]|eukprot:KXN69882.1 enoyl-CoA hydratase mitochondrial precursor [Conidiobolus coronatus NRRL 28638]
MSSNKKTGAAVSKYQNILVEIRGSTGLITLNRPKQYNALCSPLMDELVHALRNFDSNKRVGAIVITGSEKAFAAGADLREMKDLSFEENYQNNYLGTWDNISKIRKPIIAAVNGFALGGGFEIAMMCDIIYAGESAKFGLPEVKIGTIPGCGGTQRLVRAVGKAKAMEMILAGNRKLTAHQAEAAGLVARVFPSNKVVDEAIALGEVISSNPSTIVKMAKESINQSYEQPLSSGLLFERRLFHSTFATDDTKEGMTAFVAKRAPKYKL